MNDRELDALGFIRDPLWTHEERLEAQCLFQQRLITRMQGERDLWQQKYDALLALPESDQQEFARYQEFRARRAVRDAVEQHLDKMFYALVTTRHEPVDPQEIGCWIIEVWDRLLQRAQS